MSNFTRPVPRMNTSQSVIRLRDPVMVIVREIPVALESHTKRFVCPVDMELLHDPHFL